MEAQRVEADATLDRIKRELPGHDQRAYLEREVPSELWNDRHFVLSLHDLYKENHGRRNHPHLVVDIDVLELVCDDLKEDSEFMIAMIHKRDSAVLRYASSTLLEDYGFMLRAAQVYSSCIKYASNTLKASRDFGLAVVRRNGRSILYLDDSLRENREIALAAVTQDGLNIQNVGESLRTDREIGLAAVTQDGLSI